MIDQKQRTRLVELLTALSFERKKVILASGRESDFFIDCKQTILTAEGHALVGELMFAMLAELPECDAVGGVELGGCPLASAVSLVSFQKGRPLPALYVRKEQKDHGSKRLVEGDRAIVKGMPVVVLEDVITTGGSTLKAVDKLGQAGVKVVGVVALVDRLEGGAEAIRGAGLPLVSRADEHVTMDFIDRLLGARAKQVFVRAVHGLCAAIMFLLTWLMWLKADRIWAYRDATDVLRVAYGPFVYFMAVMIALTGVIHLYKMLGRR